MFDLNNHLSATEFLQLNAALQKKKQTLRNALRERGVLKREGHNAFDKYSYFSEAQYKSLFTELLPAAGLELSFTELEYIPFDGSEKQNNGRMVKLAFLLNDTDTGFFEVSEITAEGLDKGDKAGYKAYTGAVKYFLADTFLVATGDDAEKESPIETTQERKATPKQLEILRTAYVGENMEKLLNTNGLQKLEDMPMRKASDLIAKLREKNGRNT